MKVISALLPLFSWVFIALTFKRKGLSWRSSCLSASVVWGVLLTEATEILSGGDSFANFVQWFSMVGSVIGVTLIAAEFGADFRVQVYAALVAAMAQPSAFAPFRAMEPGHCSGLVGHQT